MPRARGLPVGRIFKEELEKKGYDIEKIRELEDHEILEIFYKIMPHKVNGKPLNWRTIERVIVNVLKRKDYNHRYATQMLAKKYGIDDLPSKAKEYLPVLLRVCVHLEKKPETEEELMKGLELSNTELAEKTLRNIKQFLGLNNKH